MPYSTACSTPLSNFEAGQNYKDVQDPAVYVSFPMDDDPDQALFVAWTTTPWTLPSNLALCVNPDFDYVKARDPSSGKVYLVAEERLSEIPGAVPKPKKGGGQSKKDKKSKAKEGTGIERSENGTQEQPEGPAVKKSSDDGFEIIARMKGKE